MRGRMKRAVAAAFFLAAITPLSTPNPSSARGRAALPITAPSRAHRFTAIPASLSPSRRAPTAPSTAASPSSTAAATVPLSSVTFSAPDVTFAQSASGFTYRGKLSADGQSITGTWTQSNQTSRSLCSSPAPTPSAPKSPAAHPVHGRRRRSLLRSRHHQARHC